MIKELGVMRETAKADPAELGMLTLAAGYLA